MNSKKTKADYILFKPTRQTKRKPHILLVEDDPTLKQVMKLYLKKYAVTIKSVSSGKEAFKIIENSFDLILLDIGLPDCHGLEIASTRRAYESYHKKLPTPIVVLTSWFIPDLIRRCRDLAIDEIHSKVIEPQTLYAFIRMIR